MVSLSKLEAEVASGQMTAMTRRDVEVLLRVVRAAVVVESAPFYDTGLQVTAEALDELTAALEDIDD